MADPLLELFAEGLGMSTDELSEESSPDTVEAWGSLATIEDLQQRHGFGVVSGRAILAAPGPGGRDVHDHVALLRRTGAS